MSTGPRVTRELGVALVIVAVSALPALLTGALHPAAPAWHEDRPGEGEIALSAALGLGDSAIWIDARSGEAYADGHIPGAFSLHFDDWDALIEPVVMSWLPEQAVIVYCDSRSCDRSHEVATRLREDYGMSPVQVLHRGWEGWQAQPRQRARRDGQR